MALVALGIALGPALAAFVAWAVIEHHETKRGT